jgi:hypothetical protein
VTLSSSQGQGHRCHLCHQSSQAGRRVHGQEGVRLCTVSDYISDTPTLETCWGMSMACTCVLAVEGRVSACPLE